MVDRRGRRTFIASWTAGLLPDKVISLIVLSVISAILAIVSHHSGSMPAFAVLALTLSLWSVSYAYCGLALSWHSLRNLTTATSHVFHANLVIAALPGNVMDIDPALLSAGVAHSGLTDLV